MDHYELPSFDRPGNCSIYKTVTALVFNIFRGLQTGSTASWNTWEFPEAMQRAGKWQWYTIIDDVLSLNTDYWLYWLYWCFDAQPSNCNFKYLITPINMPFYLELVFNTSPLNIRVSSAHVLVDGVITQEGIWVMEGKQKNAPIQQINQENKNDKWFHVI